MGRIIAVSVMRLNQLAKNQIAQIAAVSGDDAGMEAKLREIGFAEGDEVEIVHLGPIGGKPICVRLNQTLIALRAEEAAAVAVAPRS